MKLVETWYTTLISFVRHGEIGSGSNFWFLDYLIWWSKLEMFAMGTNTTCVELKIGFRVNEDLVILLSESKI